MVDLLFSLKISRHSPATHFLNGTPSPLFFAKTFFRAALILPKTINSTPSLLFFRTATVFCKKSFRNSLVTSEK